MKLSARGATYLLAAAFSLGGLAVQAAESVPVEQYHYGMQLDVRKVLALHEESSSGCRVVSARMDYLDSMGHKRSLEYRKLSSTCSEGN
ncbi:DUF2790 domain-containing protein [Ectopseudomonas hydrolytica]|uniref:DUF2790 domain-containing protein n=1 Tax=Ectopseudomonas hydrolytica TaxID=2493633 RepID=UPI0010FC2737|nr:DUF2790 domain-containing protein [Pseudomonas hydrolytica]ARS49280.1 Type IIA topoisomerase (DNA gyrase/topo II, topoisomerase IV), A subunit [Pseudomonas mendocina]MBF8164647.1 DUF2790 domain-containing protein [Pseudomonas mendocina]UTH29603.1 DUF2790 domain-containing protein [Pseudomonas hydrolytica]UZZ08632.1 DUF2790 domain-containing protein [Pseudomonas mendocina]